MNITVSKSKYDKQYHAHVKDAFWRSGKTKDEAYNACQAAIEEQARNMTTRDYVFTNDGTVFVLYYADGWHYDIMDAQRNYPSGTMHVADTRAEALEIMKRHAETFGGIVKRNKTA